MKARLFATLSVVLVAMMLVPMSALTASKPLSPGERDRASQRSVDCSPTELARLSAAIEEARTAWAGSLSSSSYKAFKDARGSFSARSSACARSVDASSPSSPSSNGTQSTSEAPYVVPASGIAVDIRSSEDSVNAGEYVVYAVTVITGASGGSSTGVSVSVTLPVFADGPQYVDNTGGCAFATPNLTCPIGTMAANDMRSFLVRMSTPPDLFFDGTTALVASATVTRTEADAASADNSDSSSTLVTELSDLRIFKYMLPTAPVAGEIAQYTIWVENRGPSTAREVTIRDTLLNGAADSSGQNTTIQSCAFSVSQGGGSITQFTCTTGPLVGTQFGSDIGTFSTNRLDPLDFDKPAPNPADPDLVQGRLRASFRLVFNRDITVVNMAAVESSTPDPDYSDNNAETFADVLAASNLVLNKTATAEEQQTNQAGLIFNNAIFGQAFPTAPNYFASTRVTAGRRIQYQITVSNPGSTLAEDVVLTDRLPPGVRIYQGSLAVTSTPVVANPGTCVTGTPGDPNDPLVCGLGTLRPVSSTNDQFSAAIPHTKVVTFEVIVDANVAAGTVLENDATVSASGLEIDNTDNRDFTQNTVLAAADLNALKTSTGQNLVFVSGRYVYQDLANQVTAGHVLRSSITVQNNGPSDSRNVTIQDQLPDVLGNGIQPLKFLRAENAECRPDAVHARDIYCSLGTMVAGERRTFDVYTLVDEEVPDATVLANCATALSGSSNTAPPGSPPSPPTGGPTQTLTFDPLATNNQSCTNVTVNHAGSSPAQGLSIDKAGPATASAGQVINYTLTVTNVGPGNAGGVVVTDFLPAELRNIAITPSQGSCNTGIPGDSSRPLVCNLNTVAAGATATVGIAGQVIPSVPGGSNIFNDAQVTSSASDAYNSDNIDTVSTSVTANTRPDGQIRRGFGKYVGNNIYNLTGAGQTKQGFAPRGSTITFFIKAETDAPLSDSFTIGATGAATTGYTVTYIQGRTDITAAVVAGTYTTPVLAPGATFVIKAKVRINATATAGSNVTRLVTITSVGNSANQDAVMFVANRR